MDSRDRRHSIGRAWESLLDLVYPIRCVSCDRIGEDCFCASCRSSIVPILSPFCFRCQEPEEPDLCPGCRFRPPAFTVARVAGVFGGSLQEAIHALKYAKKERLAEPLADLLAGVWEREPNLRPSELLLPLPIHRRREGERGFNQSALLAKRLSLLIEIPVEEGALTRPHYRRPQVGLGRAERQRNVEGVFHVERAEEIAGKLLLLIDDVLTTGATCHEAARALREAGAKEVRVLALAREPYHKPTEIVTPDREAPPQTRMKVTG